MQMSYDIISLVGSKMRYKDRSFEPVITYDGHTHIHLYGEIGTIVKHYFYNFKLRCSISFSRCTHCDNGNYWDLEETELLTYFDIVELRNKLNRWDRICKE